MTLEARIFWSLVFCGLTAVTGHWWMLIGGVLCWLPNEWDWS